MSMFLFSWAQVLLAGWWVLLWVAQRPPLLNQQWNGGQAAVCKNQDYYSPTAASDLWRNKGNCQVKCIKYSLQYCKKAGSPVHQVPHTSWLSLPLVFLSPLCKGALIDQGRSNSLNLRNRCMFWSTSFHSLCGSKVSCRGAVNKQQTLKANHV